MKITKSKLKQIITEELNAVMIDEGVFSTLKKGFKKVTGSHASELKQYDPWMIESMKGAWDGFVAILQAMKDQNIRVDMSKKMADVTQRAASLAPYMKKAGGSDTARFLSRLSKARNPTNLLSVMGENSVSVVRNEIKKMYEAGTGQSDGGNEQGAKDYLGALKGLDYNGQPVGDLKWISGSGLTTILGGLHSILQYTGIDVEEITKAGNTLTKIKPKLEAAKEALAPYEPSEGELEHFAKNPAMKRLGYTKPPLQGTKLGKYAGIWMQSNSLGVTGEPSGKFRKISQLYSAASKAINDAVAGFKG